jgi:hypothetical protein
MTPEEWRTLAYLWVGLTIAVGLLARRYRRSWLRWCVLSLLVSPLLALAFLFAVGKRHPVGG